MSNLVICVIYGADPQYPYSAANYFPNFAVRVIEPLRIFPLNAKEIKIALPEKLGYIAFSPDRRFLYATPFGSPPMLVKIDLKTAQVDPVPGTQELVGQIAVSSDQRSVIVSGSRGSPANRACGVFIVTLPGGTLQQVLTASDCSYTSSWTDLTVSPDGARLLAKHNRRWELINLPDGSTQVLSDKTWGAALSPDGKWIAVLCDYNHTRLKLLDASDLSLKRNLGGANGGLYWSPDSRFLLLYKDQLRCGLLAYYYSIEILDVQTGQRNVPKSSRCAILGGVGGWVSNEIALAH